MFFLLHFLVYLLWTHVQVSYFEYIFSNYIFYHTHYEPMYKQTISQMLISMQLFSY